MAPLVGWTFGRRSILLHLSGPRPLSVPAACGRYEIYHLKYPSYPILIITLLFTFVKDIPVAQVLLVALFIYGHHCDNGILEIRRITICF